MKTALACFLISAPVLGAPPASPVTSPPPAPIEPVCTRIHFDLRSMPVFDGRVDPAGVRARRDVLAQRVRDTAGLPAITILYPLTETAFEACFTRSATQTALERCAAVVAEVAPPLKPGTRGRAMFRGPRASACAVKAP